MSEEYIEEGINGQWTDWKFEAENYKKIYEHLYQENQDLKEKIILLKASEPMLELEKYYGDRDKYKEVIEEVREYIETQKKKPYKSLSEKATICNKYNEVLQILDKVKD